MAQAPIMPLFTDALIGDTTHLSAEQFGCYLLILIATWRNNGKALPDDDARMAKICKIGTTKWRRKVQPILREMFEVNESGWHQQRLEKEWNRVSRWLELQQAKGQAGGKQSASRRASRKQANHKPKEASLPLKESNPTDQPESLNAAREAEREKEESGVQIKVVGDSEEGRSAPLEEEDATPPRRNGKSPALKAAIRDHLMQKHGRFLAARARPEEIDAYWQAMLDDDPAVAKTAFEATDAKMRGEGWDDTRNSEGMEGIAA